MNAVAIFSGNGLQNGARHRPGYWAHALKFFGIKIIAELHPQRRITGIVLLIAIAEAALFGFSLTPPPYRLYLSFRVRSSPGDGIWHRPGRFLQGRRVTELLTAGLWAELHPRLRRPVNHPSAGAHWHAPDALMPCIAGLIAVVPMGVFIWTLAQVPPPSPADPPAIPRVPMDTAAVAVLSSLCPRTGGDRADEHAITVLRSIRSDYAAEIWSGLSGKKVKTPPRFTSSEMVVALIVMLANGLCFLIKDNRTALCAWGSAGAERRSL